jgi:uncharacterized protein YndB with AHSA1/START domain
MTRTERAATFVMPSDKEVVLTRVFDAPRQLVWKAFTDPASVQRRWGPRRYTTVVDTMDVRPGGAWRIVNRGVDGSEYWFRGVFSEVVKPERLVRTFEFEGTPGHDMVESTTLEEIADRTNVTVVPRFRTKDDWDGMVSSGMKGRPRAWRGSRSSWR